MKATCRRYTFTTALHRVGLNQTEFAQRMGLDKGFVSHLMKGNRELSARKLPLLIKVLRLSDSEAMCLLRMA